MVKVTFTPTEGSTNPTYTAVTITVTCEVTGFTVGNAGTTSIAYNVFEPLKIIDASVLTYTQTPACGYTYTSSYTYTIPASASAFVSQGSYLTPSFEVATSDTSKASGTAYTLTLTNDITINSGQG